MRALSKGVNKGRCFAMKMIYEAPAMYAEAFAPNQYVAACTNPVFELDVPPMEVRCQTDGHKNTATTNIFFASNRECEGKYDPNAADSGYVDGVWGTALTKPNFGYPKRVDWFYEDSDGNGVIDNSEINGQDTGNTDFSKSNFTSAFKGWFTTWEFAALNWVSHVFYAKTEQVAQYNVS